MPKTKLKFLSKKINKRKKSLPVGWFQKLKRVINSLSFKRNFGLLLLAILGVGALNHYHDGGISYFFKADILQTPAPFDGTVYPVDKVPNWTQWKGNNKVDLYSSISNDMLIPLPDYDLNVLQFPDEQLQWGNPEHEVIRNAKLTYPVVYMGNYEMDYHEGEGSHLAVDMRMPVGTPVKSIANGRVIKISMTESGFGHHIVVQHENVPSYEDPNKKVTLYSAFNHMDKIYVNEGQVVKKGQLIGTSGNTGTSTTPHLHFQIDTDSAPWHPFWPFTWEESQQAGLSFFEAVNAGLGKEAAQQNTINPLKYVKKYLNGTVNLDPKVVEVPEDNQVDENQNQEPEEQPEEVPVQEPIESNPGLDPSLLNVTLTANEQIAFVNNSVQVSAQVSTSELSQLTESDQIEVLISEPNGSSKRYFKPSDFTSGKLSFSVSSGEVGTTTVEMGKGVIQIEFISTVKPISALGIQANESFQENVATELKIQALDENLKPTPVANFVGSIALTAKEGQATFSPSQLTSANFKNGVATVKMTVTNSDRVIVRAQQGALVGESEPLYRSRQTDFTDVPPSHPNYKAIMALRDAGVIDGYSDGSFKPDAVVVRVEALKMLMLAFDIQPGSSTELPFTDTDEAAWYATTLSTAFQRSIVKGYPDHSFRPGQTVKIAEYLKMLFETNDIDPYTDLTSNPYEDVPMGEWYAGYAYLTNKKNLMDVNNNRLRPAEGMTRKDVAESIYRLKYLLDNDLVSYSG